MKFNSFKTFYIYYTTEFLKILLFLKKPFSKGQRAWNCQAPRVKNYWNQIIEELRKINKLNNLYQFSNFDNNNFKITYNLNNINCNINMVSRKNYPLLVLANRNPI